MIATVRPDGFGTCCLVSWLVSLVAQPPRLRVLTTSRGASLGPPHIETCWIPSRVPEALGFDVAVVAHFSPVNFHSPLTSFYHSMSLLGSKFQDVRSGIALMVEPFGISTLYLACSVLPIDPFETVSITGCHAFCNSFLCLSDHVNCRVFAIALSLRRG